MVMLKMGLLEANINEVYRDIGYRNTSSADVMTHLYFKVKFSLPIKCNCFTQLYKT